MKKLFLFLTLSTSFIISAQGEIKFGVNAGATFSNLRGDVDDEFKSGLDFLVGFGLEVPVNEKLSILANINYERKSIKATIDDSYKSSVKFRMHYITVPVNAKYYLGAKKNFFVQAGPYAGFFVDDTFFINGKEQTSELAGGSEFKLLDLGISTGIGTQFKVDHKHHISLSLRNNLGLTNVSDMASNTIKTNAFNFVFTWESNM